MTPKLTKTILFAAALTVPALTNHAIAGSLLVSVSDAGQTTSALDNTNVFDFNDLSTGYNYDVSMEGVGSFDQLFISNANVWGGAVDESTGQASKFSWVGNRWSNTTTLSLNSPSSYFGFWWSAGDASNLLTFYSGADVVAEYTTASMFDNLALGTDYYGNPLTGGNKGEPYAFINFFGDENTSWDSVELTTQGGGGFESDNYTTRIESFNPLSDSIADIGTVVGEVNGTQTTTVDSGTTTWVWAQESAPGAPTPPLYALMLFAAVLGMKDKIREFKR
ncbi:hypothetical protein [Rubritalea marina]|uniref:Npun_F0296 family exosortase-dependent surface protein n=1 Tax=Rubritalea marina TaxID=361055 RepID=UPI0003733C38|nr:hypothetical protein [Rubritalea marina]